MLPAAPARSTLSVAPSAAAAARCAPCATFATSLSVSRYGVQADLPCRAALHDAGRHAAHWHVHGLRFASGRADEATTRCRGTPSAPPERLDQGIKLLCIHRWQIILQLVVGCCRKLVRAPRCLQAFSITHSCHDILHETLPGSIPLGPRLRGLITTQHATGVVAAHHARRFDGAIQSRQARHGVRSAAGQLGAPRLVTSAQRWPC